MFEWKRIVLSWKTGLLFLGLLIFAGNLFYKETQRGFGTSEDASLYYDTYCRIYREITEQEVQDQQKLAIDREEAYYQKVLDGTSSSEEKYDYVIWRDARAKLDLIAAYPDYLKGLQEQYEWMSSMGVFFGESGFARENAGKTLRDFERLQGVEIPLGNDLAVEKLLSEKWSFLVLLVFGVYLCMELQNGRNEWQECMIRTTRKGRGSLYRSRLLILAAGILVMSAALSLVYGGISAFVMKSIPGDVPAQSMEVFQSVPWRLSLRQVWNAVWLVTAMGAFAVTVTVWTVFSQFRNRKSSWLVLVVLGVPEYLGYRFVTLMSKGNLLHIWNLFSAYDKKEWVAQYVNISFFGHPVNTQWLSLGFYGGWVIGCIIWGCLQMKRYPLGKKGRLDRFMENLEDKSANLWAPLPVWCKEVYKILFLQKGWLALLLCVLYIANSWEERTYYTSGLRALQLRTYEKVTGELSEDTYEYLERIRSEAESQEQRMLEAAMQLEEGTISLEEYYQVKNSVWDVPYQDFLGQFSEKLEELEEVKTRTGITPWVIDTESYDRLIGKNSRNDRVKNMAVAIAVTVFVSLSVYRYEKKQGMISCIRTTRKGRRWLDARKKGIVFGTVLLVWGGIYGVELLNHCQAFPLHDLSAPAQSVPAFYWYPWRSSVFFVLIGVYVLRLFVLLGIGSAVLGITKANAKKM